MQKQLHDDRNICGAKTRAGTPCQQKAGWGTNHVGEGRCKLHGGASTGPPKKNKNAVSTGEHETIWMDTLSDEEKLLLPRVKHKVIDLINDDIKLIEIRIRRMMQRINLADDAENVANIEEALTRVQGKKTRLLKLKYQVENDQAPDSVNIDNYINAIRGRSEEVWKDDE
jgi:uncharacterized protein YjcR